MKFHANQMGFLFNLVRGHDESDHDCHKSGSQEDSCSCDEPEEDEECEYCGGEGEVSTDEMDADGNIERGVGSQKCICQIDSGDDYDPDAAN